MTAASRYALQRQLTACDQRGQPGYRGAQAGRWDRIARGIYLPVDASTADWDQIEAATRRPDATICLASALTHHDLTDAIPAALDIAIPRWSRTPASTGAIAWHHFDRATF